MLSSRTDWSMARITSSEVRKPPARIIPSLGSIRQRMTARAISLACRRSRASCSESQSCVARQICGTTALAHSSSFFMVIPGPAGWGFPLKTMSHPSEPFQSVANRSSLALWWLDGGVVTNIYLLSHLPNFVCRSRDKRGIFLSALFDISPTSLMVRYLFGEGVKKASRVSQRATEGRSLVWLSIRG